MTTTPPPLRPPRQVTYTPRPKPKKDRWVTKLILPAWAENKFTLPIRVRSWQGNGS